MVVEIIVAGVVSLGIIAVARALIRGFFSLALRCMTPARSQTFREYHHRQKLLPPPE